MAGPVPAAEIQITAPRILLAVFIFIWINDTGAFLVGCTLGKHRLFERISPKKSWEGFFGGLITAVIASVLIGFGYELWDYMFTGEHHFTVNIPVLIAAAVVSTFLGYVIGLPVGILLTVTDKDGIKPNAFIYRILDVIINIMRSIPFLILLILLIPFTRFLVGKSYGTTATIVPLVVSAAPYIARMVESSLKEVDAGVIEAARSMGASNWTIVFRVLLVEAKTSLIVGATITLGTILGYSAMAGTVAGGGLGDLAIQYGYYRWRTDIMLMTVALLVILFQIFQMIGMKLASVLDHRK